MNKSTVFWGGNNEFAARWSCELQTFTHSQPRIRSPVANLPGFLCGLGFALLAVTLLAFAPSPAALSQDLGSPQGSVILRVTGVVDCPNTERGAAFDRTLLESLGTSTLITRTPWTDGEIRFEGVLARKLFAAACARGNVVHAKAHNDYMVEIPMVDFTQSDVLLATSMDGKALTLRDNGPVWIIYPAVDGGHTREQQNRMVWQLKELIVE